MESEISLDGLASVSFAKPKPSLRGACGACHKTKAKCIFEPGHKQCSRCCALGRPCIPRKKKRMGRRPAPELFPHGCAILELDSDSDTRQVTKKPIDSQPASEMARFPGNLVWSAQDIGLLQPSILWESSLVAAAVGSLHSYTPSPPVQPYPELGNMLATKEGFFKAHRKFMLGQSFVEDFQLAVRSVFARAPETLGLAYSTCLHILSYRQLRPQGLEGINIKYGSQCLDLLMRASSCIRDAEDAAVVIMMGQILLVYNMMLSCGSPRKTITQGVLLAVKDWYPALIQKPLFDSITLTPVLLDTIDCMIRRQMPMVRLPAAERLILDRILGLCSSLMPLIYNLCEQSYQVKVNGLDSLSALDECNPYKEIEDKIKAWTPPIPPELFTKCSSSEIAAVLAQARSYRIAALLVIHRLRFPLGIEDEIGHSYATTIVDEVTFMTQWPVNGATGFGLDFPLLVAMMEMPGSGGDLFRAFGPLRFQPHLSNQMIDLVTFVRKEYMDGFNGLWFDLVERSNVVILIP